MRKQKLKSLLHDLEILVDSLKTEIYSDTKAYTSGTDVGAYYKDDDDDDGYAD